MQTKSRWMLILGVIAGFLGGGITNGIMSYAQGGYPRTVAAEMFQLVNQRGQVTGSWANCQQDAPCLNLFDANGVMRLQMGVYSASSERGLPFVILNNERGEAKMILRLFGNNAAPVLVMKNNNQDKLIMGLDFQNSTEPFLVRFDNNGNKNVVFGNF